MKYAVIFAGYLKLKGIKIKKQWLEKVKYSQSVELLRYKDMREILWQFKINPMSFHKTFKNYM